LDFSASIALGGLLGSEANGDRQNPSLQSLVTSSHSQNDLTLSTETAPLYSQSDSLFVIQVFRSVFVWLINTTFISASENPSSW